MDIGKKIKELRLKKEWSQEDLGIKLGVKKQQVSLYEKGKNIPPLDKLLKLCQVFEIEMNDLSSNTLREQAGAYGKDIESLIKEVEYLKTIVRNQEQLIKLLQKGKK